MTTSLHRHTVVLHLPGSVPALILYGRHVVFAMTNNPWFPSPVPDLGTVSGALDVLSASEVTAGTGAMGAAAARNVDKKKVVGFLNGLASHVQSIVDLHEGEAAVIIASAGMFEKKPSARTKPNLEATMGKAPAEVLLRAKAVRGAAYEWQVSSDGGETWVALSLTTVADTSVTGLTRGATYLFRFRTTRRKVTGAWSESIAFLVH